jgi:hypothetical protein
LSAGEITGGVDLPIRIWLEFVDEADQESPDPASSIARVFVAAGIENQCSTDLAAGLLDCKFVELLVEVCDGLIVESARGHVTWMSNTDGSLRREG